ASATSHGTKATGRRMAHSSGGKAKAKRTPETTAATGALQRDAAGFFRLGSRPSPFALRPSPAGAPPPLDTTIERRDPRRRAGNRASRPPRENSRRSPERRTARPVDSPAKGAGTARS